MKKLCAIYPNLNPSDSLAYFLGAFLGDGAIDSKNYRIDLSVKSKEFAFAFMQSLKEIGAHPWVYYRRDDYRYSVRVKSKVLCNWLLSLSLSDIKNMLLGDTSLIISFIRGFYDAEGSFNRSSKVVFFWNSNQEILILIRDLLDSLGFKSTIHLHNRKNGFSERQMYYLYLRGGKKITKKFLELINPSISSKNWG